MSNEINTGGPVFPCRIPTGGLHRSGEPEPTTEHLGMTLRDYFAAKALPSILAPNPSTGQYAQIDDFPACAVTAYAMADAMLKARQA